MQAALQHFLVITLLLGLPASAEGLLLLKGVSVGAIAAATTAFYVIVGSAATALAGRVMNQTNAHRIRNGAGLNLGTLTGLGVRQFAGLVRRRDYAGIALHYALPVLIFWASILSEYDIGVKSLAILGDPVTVERWVSDYAGVLPARLVDANWEERHCYPGECSLDSNTGVFDAERINQVMASSSPRVAANRYWLERERTVLSGGVYYGVATNSNGINPSVKVYQDVYSNCDSDEYIEYESLSRDYGVCEKVEPYMAVGNTCPPARGIPGFQGVGLDLAVEVLATVSSLSRQQEDYDLLTNATRLEGFTVPLGDQYVPQCTGEGGFARTLSGRGLLSVAGTPVRIGRTAISINTAFDPISAAKDGGYSEKMGYVLTSEVNARDCAVVTNRVLGSEEGSGSWRKVNVTEDTWCMVTFEAECDPMTGDYGQGLFNESLAGESDCSGEVDTMVMTIFNGVRPWNGAISASNRIRQDRLDRDARFVSVQEESLLHVAGMAVATQVLTVRSHGSEQVVELGLVYFVCFSVALATCTALFAATKIDRHRDLRDVCIPTNIWEGIVVGLRIRDDDELPCGRCNEVIRPPPEQLSLAVISQPNAVYDHLGLTMYPSKWKDGRMLLGRIRVGQGKGELWWKRQGLCRDFHDT